MSDTYFIKNIKCAYCGKGNDFEEEMTRDGLAGLPYTSEFGGKFICADCGKENKISIDFTAVKSKSYKTDDD